MNVLVDCEFSGIVREAFRERGHEAWSCDLLDTDITSKYHIKGDAIEALGFKKWDLLIAHPPCTFLTVAANKWMKPEYKDKYPTREQDRLDAIAFFMALYNTNVPKVAVENPIGIMSTRFRKPDQILQPWQYGHPETKATCLWLKGLPKLIPTNIVPLPDKRSEAMRIHYLPPSKDRWKLRSTTFLGIAKAMAEQWG